MSVICLARTDKVPMLHIHAQTARLYLLNVKFYERKPSEQAPCALSFCHPLPSFPSLDKMQAVVEALSVGNLCSCSHCGAIAVLSESCKLGQSLKSIKALNVALKFCLSAGRVSCSFDATLGSIEASPQRQSQICSITKKPLATWTSHSQHQTNFGAVEQ